MAANIMLHDGGLYDRRLGLLVSEKKCKEKH